MEKEISYEALTEMLFQLDDYEQLCKRRYEQDIGKYQEILGRWENYARRFFKNPDESGILDERGPEIQVTELKERELFHNPDLEVEVIRQARYNLPFLHKTEFIKVGYMLDGECDIWADEKKRILHKGDFYILAPDAWNAAYTGQDKAVLLNVIMRKGTFTNAFYSLLCEEGIISDFFWQMLYSKNPYDGLIFRNQGRQDFEIIIKQIYRECKLKERPSNLLLKSLVMTFLAYALQEKEECFEIIGRGRVKKRKMADIIRYMKMHIKDISLSSLAEEMKLSPVYVSRYIKKESGCTFNSLLRKLRLEQAEEMLKTSQCSVEEIAEAIGYLDISSFYRNFKREYGLTPSQYREMQM